MIASILSLFLYLATFLIGIYLETHGSTQKQERLYVVWLYIFLCFGYMTGSDWRAYESRFETIEINNPYTDMGFYYIEFYAHKLIKDYWIFCGVLKCFYLYSTIRMVKQFTKHWKSTIALMIPTSLTFMLIQNPLRYMVACILINYAIVFYRNKDYKSYVITLLPTFFIHTSSVAFIVLIPLVNYARYILKVKDFILILSYIAVLFITSNLQVLQTIYSSVIGQALILSEGLDHYTKHYSIEDVNTFFTLGSILQIVFFIIIVKYKKYLSDHIENGDYICGATLATMLLSRFLIMIPTGFRLAIPFSFFFAICVTAFIKNRSKEIASFFIAYYILSFGSYLWNSYDMIPYSNSLPYIVFGHKSYNDRYFFNMKYYTERTGEQIDAWQDFYYYGY